MGCCSSSPEVQQVDTRKLEEYLCRYTSLPHVLTSAELSEFVRCFTLVDFLPGVSICADGDVGRDFYVLVEGAISMFIEEELFCAKNPGDCICMSARYPPPQRNNAAASIDEGLSPRASHVRSASSSITEKVAGFGKCMAVSTSNSKLLQLTRERWAEFQKQHEGDGVCDRIYPLLVEPSEVLGQINFFRGISSRMLQNIGLMFRCVYLRRNEILFEELSVGDSLFIVSSGTAKAFVLQEDGSEKRLKEFKAQDILGEIALIMNVPRTATVQATSNCFLLELHRENFKRFIKMVPSTGNIHSIMKSRTAEHFRKYKVPFFNSIPEEKYIILAELCKIDTFNAGTIVFHEGDPANCFYIIAHGELKVTVKAKPQLPNGSSGGSSSTENGVEMVPTPSHKRGSLNDTGSQSMSGNVDPVTGERELTRMGPGRYFGEIALVQESPRTATVTAVTRSVVLSITKENFQKFFEEAPEAIADFEVKLARYDVRLRSVLYHPVGLQYFSQHLKGEYSHENLDFWMACRDFRHLSYMDCPKDGVAEGKRLAELEKEVEAELRLMASISGSPASKQMLNSPKARRQSLIRIQGLDVAATFDLFVDHTVKKPSNAQAGDEYMSAASLNEMLRFFKIPVMPESGVLNEMASQMGYDAESHPFITREDFIRVLVDMENGKFVEMQRKATMGAQLQEISKAVVNEQVRAASGDWRAAQPNAESADPTSDYIRPDTHRPLPSGEFPAAAVAAAASSSSNNGIDISSLSLATKLLLNLVHIILELRVAKLKNTFDLYDVDHSASIELLEFQNVCTTLGIETNLSKITTAFGHIDSDCSGSITLLEFVQYFFNEKRQEKAFQTLLEARAKQIYNEFISNRAPHQVNIRGPSQRKLKEVLEPRKSTDAHLASPKSANTLPTPVAQDPTRKGITPPPTSASPSLSASTTEEASAPAAPESSSELPKITQHIFDEAEEEILKLMSSDSFSRFKQSDLFQQFLIAAGAYNYNKGAGPNEDVKKPVISEKVKLRSGSINLPKSNAILEQLAAASTEEEKRRESFLRRTATGGVVTEETAEIDSDSEDFGNPMPAVKRGSINPLAAAAAMSTEVVDIEQIGIDALVSPTGPDGKRRASLVLPPRNVVGRPTTKSVYFSQGQVPIGITTLREQENKRGPINDSFFAAVESATSSEAHTRVSSQSSPVYPTSTSNSSSSTAASTVAGATAGSSSSSSSSAAATAKPTTPVRFAPPTPDSDTETPPPPPPPQPTEFVTPLTLASSGDSVTNTPAAKSRRGSGIDLNRDVIYEGGSTPNIRIHSIKRPSVTTPGGTSPSPPPPSADSALNHTPTIQTSLNGVSIQPMLPDETQTPTRPLSTSNVNKSILQSPAPPLSSLLANGDAGEERNPLQSPVAGRRSSGTAASLLLPMEDDKNPLQSPVAGRRASGQKGQFAFALTQFNSPAAPANDGFSGVGGVELEQDPSVPPPPAAHFNDADLMKNPLQSPPVKQKRRNSQDDSAL